MILSPRDGACFNFIGWGTINARTETLGDRLMVGHIPLEDGIGVRIPVPQHLTYGILYAIVFLDI